MVFRAGLLDPEQLFSHQKACEVSKPFPHCIVSEAIEDGLLRRVKDEIDAHLPLKLDETQLYRVQRSTDLANLSNFEEYSPSLFSNIIQLRDALYSKRFRDWISQVTGSGPLSGKKSSMAVNLYTPGGHLLAHDDCNPKSKDRRVSFIIYVTDPDSSWKTEWGGALRLFATEASVAETAGDTKPREGIGMHPCSSRVIPPSFNQMVFFAINPGMTYHEVEEVHSSGDNSVDETRRRMTISGWFHAAQEGDEGFKAEEFDLGKQRFENQFRLRSARQMLWMPQPTFTGFRGPSTGNLDDRFKTSTMSPIDISFLSDYFTSELLSRDNHHTLSRRFAETGVLRLQPFLREDFAKDLERSMWRFDEVHAIANGHESTSFRWQNAGPPEGQRYLYMESLTNSPHELNAIATLLEHILKSCAFKNWLVWVTGRSISSIGDQYTVLRRFRRGSDYILETERDQTKPQLHYTLEISPVAYKTNTSRHDDQSGAITALPSCIHEADEEHMEIGQRNSISWNQFTITIQDGNRQYPVDYMTHDAVGDRWDIEGQIHLSD